MKKNKVHILVVILPVMLLAACGRPTSKKQFEINGTIKNSTAQLVYLEEVPAGSNQPTVVDSSALGKNGAFTLKADTKEAMIYNLRLDKERFPVASVINDVPRITLDMTLQPGTNDFRDKYEVTGSTASEQLKSFKSGFNKYLQQLFPLAMKGDSLHKLGVPDSAFDPLRNQWRTIAGQAKNFTLASLAKADNPALYIFELGYYQGAAGQGGFGLDPIGMEDEMKMLNDAIAKFPEHEGIKNIKKLKEEELASLNELNKPRWVGKAAPDFSIPDATGAPVALSSFKGQYVLVDFWASWCGPCRAENPNIVKAYNAFKDKNFTILGVSLDNPGEKEKWLNAVKKDNLTWTQVSDLKGWESQVVSLYRFNGIPYNVLVDPSGTIIGESLRGAALEQKLNEVLR